MIRTYFLFLLVFVMPLNLLASVDVPIQTQIYVDSTKTLTIENMLKKDLFVPLNSHNRLGFKDHAIWIKLSVKELSALQDKKYFLEYKYAKVESLNYYIVQNNVVKQVYELGSIKRFNERVIDTKNLYIPLSKDELLHSDIYARIYHMGSIPVDFSLIDINTFSNELETSSITLGILFGVLLIMALYNFILYMFTKEKYYLSYVLLVVSNLMFQLSYTQSAFKYLWPELNNFNLQSSNIFASLYVVFVLKFVFELLDISKDRLYKSYYFLRIQGSLVVFLSLLSVGSFYLLDDRYLGQLTYEYLVYVYVTTFLSIMFISLYLAFKKERTAQLFSYAWGILIVAILLFLANVLGLIDYSKNFAYILGIASIIEVALLALILADKLKTSKSVSDNLYLSNQELESKIQERTKALHLQIEQDSITHLQNRYAFFRQYEASSHNLIMLIDINAFKQLNDFYGNSIGNSILKEFSTFLSNYAKLERLEVYRISADEFVLLSQSKEEFDVTQFKILAYEFSRLLSQKKFFIKELGDNIEIEVTIAIAEGSINQADMALVEAKQRHVKVMVYSNEIDKKDSISLNLDWKQRIKNALDVGDILCFYQPILDANEKVIKYELLMRMRQEEEGEVKYISPFFFLDYAIKSNQYIELSRYVIESGIKQFDKDAKLSINLSYLEIKDEGFIEWIRGVIHSNNFFNKVVFEITESADVENYDLITRLREVFRYDGVEIAIDDFGSGYSNFSYILELKPDYIKLDGSIIKNIDTDATAFALVKSLVTLSKELGIKTIAEYVHSKEVFELCKVMGVDEYQGFYFSEPKQIEEVM